MAPQAFRPAGKARIEQTAHGHSARARFWYSIGYDRAAEIAKESAKTGKTVRELCREQQVLPEEELERALDPVAMTEPGGEGSAGG
ncbi:MAG: fumarate hydratase, class [Chthoniobacter sp.]|jgi:aspartate ammonia-lyase|nr:fumarate hydratase, class [Chthoniobacter sp.]